MSEYCLRWNNHRPNLVTVFTELLTSEALVDVTLATDGHYIHAHKLVLSACSVYFKDLFRANPCKHPIVILKDIRIEDLKTVIDFIYRGEVNVAQDRLQDVLRTAESLRIKGLAETPRNYDEMSSHGAHFSQVTQQRSLGESREQTMEGEDEGEPLTPPSSKRLKVTPSHESSESIHEEGEGEDKGARQYEVKDEPVDDRESDRSQSQAGSHEANGVSGDSTEEPGSAPGTSTDATQPSAHGQGRGKRGVLQRQQVITRDAAGGADDRRDEHDAKDIKAELKPDDKGPELIIPDTMVLSGGSVTLTNTQPTLLQVPTMMVGHRDPLGPGQLPKQHSHPTPHLTPPPIITKQLSHPESRGPPTHQGPPPISKQLSHPGVLTHTPSSEHLSSGSNTSASQQHLQVMHLVVKQRHPSVTLPSQLRPIQPKPSGSESVPVSEVMTKKELPVPLIRLTPSEERGITSSNSGYGMGPKGPIRAHSAETAMNRPSMGRSQDQLAPGPSVLIQSVSQDSGLDSGAGGRMLSATQLSVPTSTTRPASTPGHCPVLRTGPALGCNFCWNSTDQQGRVLRRKTKYHCPVCRTNLCIVPCFQEYHEQMERSQDTDKQITKILTKTSSL